MIYESIILITEWLAYGIVCLYDFRAQLYGTGSRSEIRIE